MSRKTPYSPEAERATVHLRKDPLGRSYTPDACAVALVSRLAALVPGARSVLEPCVGGGAFVRVARQAWPKADLWGVDLDPEAPGLVGLSWSHVGDCREVGLGADVVMTNPPFGKVVGQRTTLEIVERCRALSRHVAAVLLPIDVLTQRGFARDVEEATHVWPVLGRPFPQERGMVALVWLRQYNPEPVDFRPLFWGGR